VNRRPVLSPHDPRSCTAIHEAGHACIGELYGLPLRLVSIIPKVGTAGRNRLMVPIGELAHPCWQVCTWLLAGSECEKWFRKCDRARGAEQDFALTRAVLELHLGQTSDPLVDVDDELNRRARRYTAIAAAHVITHEKWIRIVATQLLVEQALSAQTVRDLRPEEEEL
jgi:hypothetical protein